VRAHDTGEASTKNTTAIGLQNSIAGEEEQHCSLEELRHIAINWVDIEDQPGIVDAVVDEEIKILESKLLSRKKMGDSDDHSSICSSSSRESDSGAPESQPNKLETANFSNAAEKVASSRFTTCVPVRRASTGRMKSKFTARKSA
jgi:hypothetical protein